MNNEMTIFNNPEFGQVRTICIEGEPWFVGKDVAEIIGYQNGSRDINRHVDEDDRRKTMIFDGNQDKETILINESGLYSLILSSKMPKARRFKRWVTSEVLPSIRKNGGYQIPKNPMEALQLMFDIQKDEKARVDDLEMRVDNLSDNALLNTGEYQYISNHVRMAADKAIQEFGAALNSKQKSCLYGAINRGLNLICGVRTRTQIRKKDFDKAIRFLDTWYISAETKELIRQKAE